jgi:hypothetical protein
VIDKLGYSVYLGRKRSRINIKKIYLINPLLNSRLLL